MRRIASEHPGCPVRVLSGDLVENPTTTGEMMKNHPTMREFFVRLAKTTGQAVGEDFLRRLEPGHDDLRMFSPDMAVPLAALKKLAPGRELEQMEAFQAAFYGEGLDVLSPEIQIWRGPGFQENPFGIRFGIRAGRACQFRPGSLPGFLIRLQRRPYHFL